MTATPVILANGSALAAPSSATESTTIAVGQEVALSLQSTTGFTSFEWIVTRRPFGSTATLGSTTGYTSTFTPDEPGEYRFRGIANGGEVRQDVALIVARTRGRGLRKAKGGERLAALAEKYNAALDELDLTAKVYNVRAYGARGDGTTDDTAAIQAAIDAACTAGGGTVLLPVGTYKTTDRLDVYASGVHLRGDGRGAVIRPTYGTVGAAQIGILLCSDASSINPTEISNLSVSNITIEYASCGPNDAAGLQVNGCRDFVVEVVTVKGDGVGMGGAKTDGFALAYNSRDGVLKDCVADGLSKPGFYLAQATNIKLANCTSRDNYGTVVTSVPGFSLGNARNVEYVGCTAEGNQGDGWVVGQLGTYSATITTLSSQTSFVVTFSQAVGSRIAEHLGVKGASNHYEELEVASVSGSGTTWTVTLASAPSTTLTQGMAIQGYFRPPQNVRWLGCSAVENGRDGIVFGSSLAGAWSSNITIVGFTAHGHATGAGIRAIAIKDTVITGPMCWGNQTGIVVDDIGAGYSVEDVTERVSIVGGEVRENSVYGIGISAANDVTINGTCVSRSSAQTAGIKLIDKTVVTSNKAPARIRIVDPDLRGYSSLVAAVAHENGDQSAPASGYYRLQHSDAPSSLRAPAGSQFVRSTGVTYTKTSGYLAAGWAS